MAELTFTQAAGSDFYECTTTVEADFNLHIERESEQPLTIDISTVDDAEYVNKVNVRDKDIDEDFDGKVYPKWLRIRSWCPITAAYLTEVEE